MTKRFSPLLLLLVLLPSLGRADVSATAPPVRPAPTESGLAAGSPLLPPRVLAQATDTGNLWIGAAGGNKAVSTPLTLAGIEAALGFTPGPALGFTPIDSALLGTTLPTTNISVSGLLRGVNGSGTNSPGSDFTLAGGTPTGNSTPGAVVIKAAQQGSTSGSTAQTLSEVARFKGGGGLSMPGYTDRNTIEAGSFGLQSYAVNNCWLSDNIYFDGGSFRRRASGYGSLLYFDPDGISINTTGSGVAGSAVGLTLALRVTHAGLVGLETNNPQAQLHVVNSSPSQPVARFDMAAGQGANAIEVRDSVGNVPLYADSTARIWKTMPSGYPVVIGDTGGYGINMGFGTSSGGSSINMAGGIISSLGGLSMGGLHLGPNYAIFNFGGDTGGYLSMNSGSIIGANAVQSSSFNTPTYSGFTGTIPANALSTHVSGGIIIGYTDSTGTTVGN